MDKIKEIEQRLSDLGFSLNEKFGSDSYKERCLIHDIKADLLKIDFIGSSLQLENLKVDRFEVIDKIGRAYVNYCDRPLNIETSLQDNERTLKIFLDD
tara:strand:+ start:109 stop:402 length:294 start_codon:yes stop_codon:yes gene_type:complete